MIVATTAVSASELYLDYSERTIWWKVPYSSIVDVHANAYVALLMAIRRNDKRDSLQPEEILTDYMTA